MIMMIGSWLCCGVGVTSQRDHFKGGMIFQFGTLISCFESFVEIWGSVRVGPDCW